MKAQQRSKTSSEATSCELLQLHCLPVKAVHQEQQMILQGHLEADLVRPTEEHVICLRKP